MSWKCYILPLFTLVACGMNGKPLSRNVLSLNDQKLIPLQSLIATNERVRRSSADPCDGTNVLVLTGDEGTITSPQYPNPYPAPSFCQWKIAVADTKVVSINFADIDIKCHEAPCVGHAKCTAEQVFIFDKHLSEMYCADEDKNLNATDYSFTSSSNELYVSFYVPSVATQNHTGFNLTWSADMLPANMASPDGSASTASINTDACRSGGVTLTGNSGMIRSTGYPNESYPPFAFCQYSIILGEIKMINIDIVDVEIQAASSSCPFDYLQFMVNGNFTQRFCKQNDPINFPNTTSYRAKAMYIFFGSDLNTEFRGYQLNWTITDIPPSTPALSTTTAATTATTITTTTTTTAEPIVLPHNVIMPHISRWKRLVPRSGSNKTVGIKKN